jgi:hypothetical protein
MKSLADNAPLYTAGKKVGPRVSTSTLCFTSAFSLTLKRAVVACLSTVSQHMPEGNIRIEEISDNQRVHVWISYRPSSRRIRSSCANYYLQRYHLVSLPFPPTALTHLHFTFKVTEFYSSYRIGNGSNLLKSERCVFFTYLCFSPRI